MERFNLHNKSFNISFLKSLSNVNSDQSNDSNHINHLNLTIPQNNENISHDENYNSSQQLI